MIYAIMIIAMVALDRWSKIWAQDVLMKIDTMPLINNVFHLTYVENTGAAFSILRGKVEILIFFTGVVLIGLFVLLMMSIRKKESKVLLLSLAMVIGGAIGNMYDRIPFGLCRRLF